MAKLIHTIFTSADEAELAQKYLVSSGLTDVSLNGCDLNIQTNEDNWISAFEIITSLGGSVENDADFNTELEEYYRIQDISFNQVEESDPEIEIVDEEAYIDSNLGYGDYELVEPYILEKYTQMIEK
jgi:hypothetical protein